jgi:hypothetical protein
LADLDSSAPERVPGKVPENQPTCDGAHTEEQYPDWPVTKHHDYTDLLNRSRYARGRVRAHIERDIAKRHELIHRKTDDILDAWQ